MNNKIHKPFLIYHEREVGQHGDIAVIDGRRRMQQHVYLREIRARTTCTNLTYQFHSKAELHVAEEGKEREREQKALNQLSGVTWIAAEDSVGGVLQREQTWWFWMMEEDKNKEFSVQTNIHSIYKETCKQYMVDISYPGSLLRCWMLFFLRTSRWEKSEEKKIWRGDLNIKED